MKLLKSHIAALCFYYVFAWGCTYLFTYSLLNPAFGEPIDTWFIMIMSGGFGAGFMLLFFLDLLQGAAFEDYYITKEGVLDIKEYDNLTLVVFKNFAYVYRERKAEIAKLKQIKVKMTFKHDKKTMVGFYLLPYLTLEAIAKKQKEEKKDGGKRDKAAS